MTDKKLFLVLHPNGLPEQAECPAAAVRCARSSVWISEAKSAEMIQQLEAGAQKVAAAYGFASVEIHRIKPTATDEQGAQAKPTRAARRLNDHHARHGAGFYLSQGGETLRCFTARVRWGGLEVSDDAGESWRAVDLQLATFKDHAGRTIYL